MKTFALAACGIAGIGLALPAAAEAPQAPPAAEKPAAEEPAARKPANGQGVDSSRIPEDLLEEEHMLTELGVNEFTVPSIAKLFDTLQFLMPIPLADTKRELPAQPTSDRANLAIELGFLIADGFLIVQAEQMDKVEELATQMNKYGKALGIGERVNRHAQPMLEHARKNEIEQLKKELSNMQGDVQAELVRLKDVDLPHLISLGGWIRALEVSSVAVDKQFSEERATRIMREDIADYYTDSISWLEPGISDRPNFIAMREILSGMRSEMLIEEGREPAREQVAEIRAKAKELADLALKRLK